MIAHKCYQIVTRKYFNINLGLTALMTVFPLCGNIVITWGNEGFFWNSDIKTGMLSARNK